MCASPDEFRKERARKAVLDELVLLSLTNRNPATSPFAELFDDTTLAKTTAYRPLLDSLKEFADPNAVAVTSAVWRSPSTSDHWPG